VCYEAETHAIDRAVPGSAPARGKCEWAEWAWESRLFSRLQALAYRLRSPVRDYYTSLHEQGNLARRRAACTGLHHCTRLCDHYAIVVGAKAAFCLPLINTDALSFNMDDLQVSIQRG
jgi:hypothetical protein